MTTLTHTPGLHIATAQVTQRCVSQVRVHSANTAPPESWIDRLAAWADRQPVHHRMGHWASLR